MVISKKVMNLHKLSLILFQRIRVKQQYNCYFLKVLIENNDNKIEELENGVTSKIKWQEGMWDF